MGVNCTGMCREQHSEYDLLVTRSVKHMQVLLDTAVLLSPTTGYVLGKKSYEFRIVLILLVVVGDDQPFWQCSAGTMASCYTQRHVVFY